jgi:hypothetical protein
VVTAIASRVAIHDPAVAAHPWLAGATRYCLNAITAIDEAPFALVLAYAMQFLDAVYDTQPEAAALLDRLAEYIPATGMVPVAGGAADETMRPLDFAPFPDRPVRKYFAPALISAELERLANQQQPDGGWQVDFASYSPGAELDWRGHTTVRALTILQRNAVI